MQSTSSNLHDIAEPRDFTDQSHQTEQGGINLQPPADTTRHLLTEVNGE